MRDWTQITDLAHLQQTCATFEAVLRGVEGVQLEDGYCVNVAALRDFIRRLEGYARHLHECARLRDADPSSPTYGQCTCGLQSLLGDIKAESESQGGSMSTGNEALDERAMTLGYRAVPSRKNPRQLDLCSIIGSNTADVIRTVLETMEAEGHAERIGPAPENG